jgi:type I restriction enzyme, S subunit
LPIIRIRDIVSGYSETYYSGKYPKEYLIDNGALLVGMDGEFNIEFWKGGKALLNQRVCQIISKDSVADILFLKYRLSLLLKRIEAETPFVTVKHLSSEKLKDEVIELPPLTEQKWIASLLARADRLRQLRRTAHDLSDALLQSVFLEMFGHVRVNDKKWELAKFEDVCETRLGKMLDDKTQTGKHKRPYLRNFNVRWDRLDLSDIAEMDFDEKDRKKFRLQYGDVLICEGGEVGRAAIWRNEMEECYFQKALHRARPNSKLANPEYIVHLLWWMAQTGGLIDSTSQVTFAHLTGEKLKELVIPVPPLSLQEEFAGVVARVEQMRSRQAESERQVEELFESLLAESFA